MLSDDEVRVQNNIIKDFYILKIKESYQDILLESYEDILLNSARIDAKQKISGFTFIQENYHKMVKKDGVLVKSAPETEITGWYQRLPEENDWHTGIIFFKKGQLKWKNEAGVEWNLQPDINNNKLITGEDNPYQTEYEPDFTLIKTSEKSKSVSQSEEYPTVSIEESYEDILLNSARIDAKQKISGFTFIQENYHKMVKKDGVLVKSAPETEITGWYQRLPEENDWHTGIIFFEKGQLKWKNEAGVEWNLQPDINNNKLITGEDNPYQTEYEPDFTLIKTSEKSKSSFQRSIHPRDK